MFRRSALLVLAAGLCLPLTACMVSIDTKEQVTTIPVPHVAGSGLKVVTRNGHITAKKSEGSDIQIIATLRMQSDERLQGTTISANRDGTGVLVIGAMPPGGEWRSNEGCSFDISVPDASGINFKSSNGRIEIAGLSGKAEVESSNGALVVSSHNGPVHAETSNGHIDVTGATGPVDCSTSNGAVRVSLAGPGPVRIDTSNGSITLEVGKAFAGSIEIRTSNGSISTPTAAPGFPSLTVQREGKEHAKVTLGTGPRSALETNNGSVTVKLAE